MPATSHALCFAVGLALFGTAAGCSRSGDGPKKSIDRQGGGDGASSAVGSAPTQHRATAASDSSAAASSATPSSSAPSALSASVASTAPREPTPGACVDAGILAAWRYSPSATLLPDGRVMVAGGRQHDGEQGTTSVEMWEPATQTFKPSSPMAEARTMHGAVVLKDGRVLIAGGRAKLIEIYNPTTDKWRKAGRTRQATVQTFVVALRDGRAIIAGGDMEWKGAYSDEVLVLDPKTSLVTEVGGLQGNVLAGEFALPRPDGSAVLLGWGSQDEVDKPMQRVVFHPDAGKAAPFTGNDPGVEVLARWPRDQGTIIGYEVAKPTKLVATEKDVRRWDAKTKTWDVVATFARNHEAGRAVLLDERRVLVLGGLEKEHAVAELCAF